MQEGVCEKSGVKSTRNDQRASFPGSCAPVIQRRMGRACGACAGRWGPRGRGVLDERLGTALPRGNTTSRHHVPPASKASRASHGRAVDGGGQTVLPPPLPPQSQPLCPAGVTFGPVGSERYSLLVPCPSRGPGGVTEVLPPGASRRVSSLTRELRREAPARRAGRSGASPQRRGGG